MKKTLEITTKSVLTRVSNNIEKKINEKLGIFSYEKFDVKRESHDDVVKFIVCNDLHSFTSSIIESVQEVVMPFVKKYPTSVYYSFGVASYWSDTFNDIRYRPSIEVMVRFPLRY